MNEIDAMEEKERKRPDVVQRLKDRKGKQERVVKCSLQGRLLEKSLLPEIQRWVLTTSKITHKGALVFNRLLLHCLNRGLPLPDLTDQTLYLQCFNIGVGKLYKANDVLKEVWDTSFQSFPSIEKCRGDTQAYVYASKQYMTNFKNSLVFTFDTRQKGYVARWCEQNGIAKEHGYAIRYAINGWGCRAEVPEEARAFVQQQRELLGTEEDGITLTWLGTHMEKVVRYFYHILQFMEALEDGKRFTLAPLCRIKCHFLTMDTTVLWEMMKNVGLTQANKADFMALRDEHFGSVFQLKGLCSGEFSHMVETDGVSVCFHFHVPKAVSDVGNRQLKKAERVIAIDPGRTNLMFGVEELSDGKTKSYKLTRGEYYTSAGMKTANRKAAKWEADIAEAELIFRQTSPKTIQEETWDKFLADYVSVYPTLWDAKTAKKWGRERFRVYCLKRKTLDTFFQTMNGEVKPVIAYGAAKFNPTSKNELSAPTTYVSKRCAKHFPTLFVDEYNTTKVCHCCDERLCPVMKDAREVRGLRWCCSTKCRTFLNRDMNAALNILRCFKSGTNRPYSLARNSGIVPKPVKAMKLY